MTRADIARMIARQDERADAAERMADHGRARDVVVLDVAVQLFHERRDDRAFARGAPTGSPAKPESCSACTRCVAESCATVASQTSRLEVRPGIRITSGPCPRDFER